MDENVKDINPPNVPQARPIENFWGCLVQKVYEGGWEAKTEQQLIRRIKSKMKEFDKNFVESLLEGVKDKVKSIGDNGVLRFMGLKYIFSYNIRISVRILHENESQKVNRGNTLELYEKPEKFIVEAKARVAEKSELRTC